ncbi:MAG: S-layer homology domain-containing protein [Clostridiales bacterium]|nr:S-layer homology domain-containing protein [Clostridiales bacterium]
MKNNFNKLLFIILISLLLLASTMVVSAESTDNLDIIVEKNIVIIQGTTAIGFDDVTLQIIRQDDGKRVYIDQVKTDESGQFTVETALDEGRYSLIAVSSGNRIEKDFTVSYKVGDANILIDKNKVTISGRTENAGEDVTIQVIRVKDGKKVYIDQLKADESGNFSVLINLEKGKYKLIVVFANGRVEKEFGVTFEDSGGSGGSGGKGGGSGGGSSGSVGGGSPSSGSSSGEKPNDTIVKPEENQEPPMKTFSDIDNFPWAKEAIEEVATKGILQEATEDTFAPEINTTRGEFVGALIRALGLTAQSDDNFIDVSADYPYYEDIKTAKALGIAKGVGDNRLEPNAFITRQDMMVLIEGALRISGKLGDKKADLTYLDQFGDKDQISDYAREAVALMVELGFIKGDGININPKGNTTRAEAAVVLYRIYVSE